MAEEKETKNISLTIPCNLNTRLSIALNEIIALAPHGMLSKKTIATAKDLQAHLPLTRSRTKRNNKLPN